jgi:hypothetical protein
MLLNKKTRFCKHKSPDCASNAIHGFLSNFKIGLMIRGVITLLQLLLGKAKITKLTLSGQLKFPVFLASFAFVAKIVLCFLRRLRGKDDGINSFACGFIAGLTVLINNDVGTRKMFALYLFARAYDATYRCLDERSLVPRLPIFDKYQHLMFTVIVNLLFSWLYFFERNRNIPVSFYAFLNYTFTAFKGNNDHIFRDIIERKLEWK